MSLKIALVPKLDSFWVVDSANDNVLVADPDNYREVDTTLIALVAELVDALDSKSSSCTGVGVRFPPGVLFRGQVTID